MQCTSTAVQQRFVPLNVAKDLEDRYGQGPGGSHTLV
ncbi:unnamed protein product [Ectocarpus sp. CCAP 1310/34]|nr:unnamed protein product [Ectocarpus sp. CCAP 1310/34]